MKLYNNIPYEQTVAMKANENKYLKKKYRKLKHQNYNILKKK